MSQIALTFPDGSVRHYDKERHRRSEWLLASSQPNPSRQIQGQLVDHDRPLES